MQVGLLIHAYGSDDGWQGNIGFRQALIFLEIESIELLQLVISEIKKIVDNSMSAVDYDDNDNIKDEDLKESSVFFKVQELFHEFNEVIGDCGGCVSNYLELHIMQIIFTGFFSTPLRFKQNFDEKNDK